MSAALTQSGLISTVAGSVGAQLSSMNLHWTAVFGVLHATYFFLHYIFASQVGQGGGGIL